MMPYPNAKSKLLYDSLGMSTDVRWAFGIAYSQAAQPMPQERPSPGIKPKKQNAPMAPVPAPKPRRSLLGIRTLILFMVSLTLGAFVLVQEEKIAKQNTALTQMEDEVAKLQTEVDAFQSKLDTANGMDSLNETDDQLGMDYPTLDQWEAIDFSIEPETPEIPGTDEVEPEYFVPAISEEDQNAMSEQGAGEQMDDVDTGTVPSSEDASKETESEVDISRNSESEGDIIYIPSEKLTDTMSEADD